MRPFVILAMVLTPSLALAQPAVTASTTTPVDATSNYIQPGVVVGGLHAASTNSASIYGAMTLEAGHRIAGTSLWVHGQIAQGTLAGFDEGQGPNSYSEARAGIEARTCALEGAACLVGGIDLGVRSEYLMAEYDHFDSITGVIVPRVGLDLGTRHVRLRPTIEVAIGSDGNGGGLSLAAAYVW